jgi:GGDEF domain-containing protein
MTHLGFGMGKGTVRIPLLTLFSLLALGLTANFLVDHRIELFLNSLLVSFAGLLSALQTLMPSTARGFSADIPNTVVNNLILQGKVPDKDLLEATVAMASRVPVEAAFFITAAILLHVIFLMYWHRVYIDELTGIPNRRALDERLAGLTGNYALAMIDIDHFKKFNDEYGHDEGDNVLRLVAQHLESELGSRAYRYGGEEFCGVFEKLGAEDAYPLANRARRKLEERPFAIRRATRRKNDANSSKALTSRNSRKVQVTISIGLAASRARRRPRFSSTPTRRFTRPRKAAGTA